MIGNKGKYSFSRHTTLSFEQGGKDNDAADRREVNHEVAVRSIYPLIK